MDYLSSVQNLGFLARAEQRQVERALKRERIKSDDNKISFEKKAAEVASYNEEVKAFNEMKIKNKISSKSSSALNTANENLNQIESNLSEIREIIKGALEGNSNTRADQLRVNELVKEIDTLSNYRVEGMKIFNGKFKMSSLSEGNPIELDFSNYETGYIDTPESTAPPEINRIQTLSNTSLNSGDFTGLNIAIEGNYVISADYIMNGSADGTNWRSEINIYDKLSGKLLNTIDGNNNNEISETQNLISATENEIAVSSGNSQNGSIDIYRTSDAKLSYSLDTGFTAVGSLDISEDYIVAANSEGDELKVFKNDGSGELIKSLESNTYNYYNSNTMDISGDNLLTLEQGFTYAEDGETITGYQTNLSMFDLNTGEKISSVDIGNEYYYGNSVALDGDKAIVGTYQNSSTSIASLYDMSTGTKITDLNPELVPGDQSTYSYYTSVDISGNYAVVGNAYDSERGNAAGAAYVFNTKTGEMIEELNGSQNEADYYGYQVSIDEEGTIAVGSIYGANSEGNDTGNINLYKISEQAPEYPSPPASKLEGLNSIEIDVFSNEAGTLAAGTFQALADISLSETLASFSGERNNVSEEDLYDLEQMIMNISTMRDTLSSSLELAEKDKMKSDYQIGSIERRLKRYSYHNSGVQTNTDKETVENLLTGL
ncbi:MAG: hypothetical protein HRT47_07195 [Candidatus Caenarcaniphilales bacterium]|nr:hypothetical protein [Candidatus Caenarcaniphilales bacterium]